MTQQALEIRRVTQLSLPELTTIKQLYEEAFPLYERREFEQLLHLLHLPDMHFCLVQTGGAVAGFYIYWPLQGFCFLEHIALLPALRGQGLGRQVLKRMLPESGQRLVLEAERPSDETSRRRIDFYQRLGFTLHAEHDYYQPPYRAGQQPVPLYLMASPPLPSAREANRVSNLIRQEVYERFYE